SWIHLLLGSSAGIFLIVISLRRMFACRISYNNRYTVKLEYEGRRVELTGMLDTGNGLYTVIGRKPVVLVNQYAIEPILSEQVVVFLRDNNPNVWLANLDKCMDLAWLSRIQVIPYHGIGSKSMLLAFRPDGFMVSGSFGCIETNDVVIGIYSGTLSGDGAYAVLLHPQVMNGLSKKEGVSICA
ncbi:MAG: sigma-E processing peptidase SpoIIGA, partial [Sporomusaceae bacterium]|nr:sigma-E processing peptidase SpoIIGA [Sporomusaceae bacterium]